MNLMLGKAGAVRGQAKRPDKNHKSNARKRRKKNGHLFRLRQCDEKIPTWT